MKRITVNLTDRDVAALETIRQITADTTTRAVSRALLLGARVLGAELYVREDGQYIRIEVL